MASRVSTDPNDTFSPHARAFEPPRVPVHGSIVPFASASWADESSGKFGPTAASSHGMFFFGACQQRERKVGIKKSILIFMKGTWFNLHGLHCEPVFRQDPIFSDIQYNRENTEYEYVDSSSHDCFYFFYYKPEKVSWWFNRTWIRWSNHFFQTSQWLSTSFGRFLEGSLEISTRGLMFLLTSCV